MAVQMNSFSRKQAGVIYRNLKEGNLEMSQDAVSRMYDLVNDGSGIDHNGSINSEIQDLRLAVDAIFADDFAKAQKMLDRFAGTKTVETVEPVEEDDEDVETYTTTTGVVYKYREIDCGFIYWDVEEPDIEDIYDLSDSEPKFLAALEKMNEWRAA